MSMSESTWRVVDSLIKGLGASIISGLIMYFGYKAQMDRELMINKEETLREEMILREERSRQEQMQKTERFNAMVEFSAKQKDLDVNLAMRMFETLLSRYFDRDTSKPCSEANREKILLLRLIGLNFQDVPINLKPLFEELDLRLKTMGDEEGRVKLQKVAVEVARRQAFRMTFLDNPRFDTGPKLVNPGGKLSFDALQLFAEVQEISEENAKVTLVHQDLRIGPFSVGYFDSPIVDNVKISPNMRASLMLISSNGLKAKMRMIVFAGDLATDRFDLKEMSRRYIEEDTTAKD